MKLQSTTTTIQNFIQIYTYILRLLEQNKGRGLYLAGGPNFLDTRYIEHMRPQILKIFEFGRELVSKVSAIKDKIIRCEK